MSTTGFLNNRRQKHTVVYTVPSRAGRRNTRARPNQQSRSGRLEGIISYYLSRILRFENDVLVDIIS